MNKLWILSATATLAVAQTVAPPLGTVNALTGQVTLNGEELPAQLQPSTTVAPGQVLETGQGNAEVLLGPGAFFRLGAGSAMRMGFAAENSTGVELLKGEAMLEVDAPIPGERLAVLMNGATAVATKPGFYAFRADDGAVAVLDGEATVYQGNAHVALKKDHSITLAAGGKLKAEKLDPAVFDQDPLYQWSEDRSQAESQANLTAAQDISAAGAAYSTNPWYWDDFADCYVFVPAGGIFYSPFGWGFYAPGTVWRAHPPINFHYHPVGTAGRVSAAVRPVHAFSGHVGSVGGGFHGEIGGGHAGGNRR